MPTTLPHFFSPREPGYNKIGEEFLGLKTEGIGYAEKQGLLSSLKKTKKVKKYWEEKLNNIKQQPSEESDRDE